MGAIWRKCSSCRKPISFLADYWACNVSTCNRPRTFFAFCTVSCWDAHLGLVRHRESWAEERKAPSPEFWEKVQAGLEIFPPRAAKEKVEEAKAPAKDPNAKPKTIIRKS